jgi:hypothetical protein
VYIPYVKGVSEKFKRIGNQYNTRTFFKTKHILRSSPMKTRPERNPQHRAQCIYSIPCECGRSYIGETGRLPDVRLREHRHNLQHGLLGKSKLAQHVLEEGHKVGWDDARILESESNSRYRKYMEAAHMACLNNPISQPSLDISPIWIPSSAMRLLTLYDVTDSSWVSIRFQSRVFGFYSTDAASGKCYISSQFSPHFFALMFVHLVLLVRFVAQISTSFSMIVPRM